VDENRKLKVTSRSFENGGMIPIKHTGFDRDMSPDFEFANLCENAVTIAIIMDDVDILLRPELNHWLIWNIPKMNEIPENIPYTAVIAELGNAVQGLAWGKNRYRGPKQPRFIRNTHRYIFRFFVLDCSLTLNSNARKQELLKAMEGHILQEGSITGKYKR
jgi:Raf kinase inhibitor-like YbhB/YbcL family protein